MPILTLYNNLKSIAQDEFADVVVNAQIMALPTGDPLKLRLDIADESLFDVFISTGDRYSYHWERRITAKNDIYRHDNAPHQRWRDIATFPKHFHNGTEDNVIESYISDDPEQAIREFLAFVRQKLRAES